MDNLKHFNFWCQKVLPLVYDDSLSYYEVLCKCVEYINFIIGDSNSIVTDIADLKKELEIVQNWIDNYDTSYAETVLAKYIATMIFVEITSAGYIVYYIPDTWQDISFSTTGLDAEETINNINYGYGHLILSY